VVEFLLASITWLLPVVLKDPSLTSTHKSILNMLAARCYWIDVVGNMQRFIRRTTASVNLQELSDIFKANLL
jgi:hypothetical protein